MGLLQKAYETYESQSHRVGIAEEGQEPLAPTSHAIVNAHIEITLNQIGEFCSARKLAKEESKTIIPVYIESAGRSISPVPHPLSDQLCYLAPYNGSHRDRYLTSLGQWIQSPYSHPKAQAVYQYIQAGTILQDLSASEVIELNPDGALSKGKILGIDYEKCLVRWRILPSSEKDVPEAWRDLTLFKSFEAYYRDLRKDQAWGLCMITGEKDLLTSSHPRGLNPFASGAKLISSNDSVNFTYRGRFIKPEEAVSIGYTASQKAHSALRWLIANHSVYLSGRTFLWWNPMGKAIPKLNPFMGLPSSQEDMVNYRDQLFHTLTGFKKDLSPQDGIVITALEAATTGRLSVTYYNELNAADFMNHLEYWCRSCCYEPGKSPTLRDIVRCAFGTERETGFIEADDKVLKDHLQQLLHCMVDQAPFPEEIHRALVVRAGQPLAYKKSRRLLVDTAYAVIRKYRNEKFKEEWTLSLDTTNVNRSYLYGRLLAIYEKVERSTYDSGESREPNAIQLQSTFTQRPLYASRILDEKSVPYFNKLSPGLRTYYRNMIQEILSKLSTDDTTLNRRLDDVYLLGYYHQRAALWSKKENTENEGESL